MQTRDRIKIRVRELVEEIAPIAPESINPTSRLVEDVSLDSVTILELVVTLEEEFDLPPIGQSQARSVVTLEQLQEFVASLAEDNE